MVEIYASDIDGFTLDDWEDMIYCGAGAEGDWEELRAGKPVEFTLPEHPGTLALPCGSFTFIRDRKRSEPVEWSGDLKSLLGDIILLKEMRRPIYRTSMRVWDTLLKEGMDIVAETFSEYYDGAMGRALLRMLAELQGVEDEFPVSADE